MKVTIVLVVAVLAVTLANPVADKKPIAKTLNSEFEQSPEGGYKYSFDTDNNINRNEVGELKPVKDYEGKEHDVVVIHGSYSYQDPEGQLISVNYVADENGFQVEGDHIPKPVRK